MRTPEFLIGEIDMMLTTQVLGAAAHRESSGWRSKALRWAATLGIVASAVLSGTCAAHGGLSMDSDGCKLMIGPFNMHFSGYQPQANGNQEFCEDIPKTGSTIIVMDALESDLREIPIEVRVIKDTGDLTKLDEITVIHMPPKVYDSGSIPLEYNFQEAGKYVGLVSAGSKGQYVARFPFSVGVERFDYRKYALFLGIALMAWGLYRYAGRVRAKTAHQAN